MPLRPPRDSAACCSRLLLLSIVLMVSLGTVSQVVDAQGRDEPQTPVVPGPPVPPLPATIARDAEGRATVRVVRLDAALNIDGRLDEPIYDTLEPISDFIQMEPNGGQPASEKTDIWLSFDADNIYVSMRAWESRPDRVIANEMRRDSGNIRMGDCVGFMFDTFYDRRNAIAFEVSPLGARTDGQVTNERQYNGDWNPVWDAAVGKFAGGWTMEAAIPFKSIRYRPGEGQVWGFSARRNNKWKNEISFLTRTPPAFGIGRGTFAASLYATAVGIEAPSGSKNLEIKPYAISDVTTDLIGPPRRSNDLDGDVGFDLKYGLSQNVTADFTYNTDFAQVEADEQQVNLTRFSLFFPEKREFFLENQGTFAFAGLGGGQTNTASGGGETPILFYSRRIGLSSGKEVPLLGGGRLTGRLGRFSVGALNIEARKEASAAAVATNFSVLRVKRDVLRRSSVGAILTSRSVAQNLNGSNQAYGVDGTFAFFQNLAINTFWAQTRQDGLDDDDVSYRAHLDYGGDRFGLQLERLAIGSNFNPEVGFVRRRDIRQDYAQFRFSPRPTSIKSVRKLSSVGSVNYIEDGAGRVETRLLDGEFAIEFQNSDRVNVGITDSHELLKQPFAIAPTILLAPGDYDFTVARAGFTLGQQRPFSGTVLAEYGTFYNGDRRTITVSRTRMNLSPRLSLEPTISVNWVDLPQGSFTARLAGSRVTYTMTPLMFASALVQYNSSTNLVSTNVRLRWEYRPGSELFVVYNDERNSLTPRFPDLQNRAFVVKVNRLFRF